MVAQPHARHSTRRPTRGRRGTPPLRKVPTGIVGFDDITGGGLPKGRTTLVCGGPGCGKTLFAMEFLARGATEFGDPGVFISFEETENDLIQNVASLGFDLPTLIAKKKMIIDHVVVDPLEIQETGEFDLDGLFIRIDHAIRTIGAKRVALDTLESIFSGLPNQLLVRAELRRLFLWLKERGVTAVLTAEKGEKTLTREGLEEYVSDCVIVLEHRTVRDVTTRRLRVAKYRGSAHQTNEFPFLIDEKGFSVVPITSARLDQPAGHQRISSGIPALDEMLGGKGFFRGSSILVSGTAGTGKSTLAAHFLDAACRRGERAIYFSFEETPETLMRDMRSVGIDLRPWVEKGLLRFHCSRASRHGMEMHAAVIARAVREFKPTVAAIDPVSVFETLTDKLEAKNFVVLVSDMMRSHGVSAMMTHLTHGGNALEATGSAISSLADVWVLLRDVESGGERNRTIYVLKARGTKHSNQLREFVLTDRGVQLETPYVGPAGVLTGSARASLEAREEAEAQTSRDEIARKRAQLRRAKESLDAQIAAMRQEFASKEEELERGVMNAQTAMDVQARARKAMAVRRGPGSTAQRRGAQ